MALQVWLPLNGDLHNQGLSDVTVTNNGATVSNAGKIGKCYEFGGTSYIDTNFIEDFGTNDFTISAWIYIVQTTGKTYQCIIGNKSTAAKSAGCAIYWNQNQKKFLWSTADGNNSTEIWSVDTFDSIIYNSWHHIAMVRNSNDPKKGYFYLDGIRKEIASVPAIRNVSSSVTFKLGSVTPIYNAYYFTGKINDVRIYNHALSAREVKEISKGLVLHYKLDDPYIGTINNLVPSGNYSTVPNGSTWGCMYTVNTVEESVGPVPFKYNNKIVMTKLDTGSGGGHGVSRATYIPISGNTTYTYSMYIKADDNLAYTHANFLYRREYNSSNTQILESGTFNPNTNKEYIGDDWYRIWGTFTSNSETTKITLAFFTYPNKNITYYIGGTQLEVGNTLHAYVDGTSTENMVYDSSGYGNDGTITGTLSMSNDSQRYINSVKFDGTSYIYRTPLGCSAEIKTISFWANWNSIPSGQSVLYIDYGTKTGFGLMNTGILLTTSQAGSSKTYSKSGLIANTWYHFVIVITGATTRDLYINGVKQTPTSNTSNWTCSVNQIQIGKRSTTSDGFVGKMVDFRMYSTVLSDDDILKLYNTSGFVDDRQNVGSFEFVEDSTERELYPIYSKGKITGTGSIDVLDDGSYQLSGCYWPNSEYIPINPSGKTYYYDIEYSNVQGNLFYIGFEKYDANKQSGSNGECQYLASSTASANHKRITGTINLATANNNPAAYTKLRLLNNWNNVNDATYKGTIHYISLKEVTTKTPAKVKQNGEMNGNVFIESMRASISQTGNITSNNLLEI